MVSLPATHPDPEPQRFVGLAPDSRALIPDTSYNTYWDCPRRSSQHVVVYVLTKQIVGRILSVALTRP